MNVYCLVFYVSCFVSVVRYVQPPEIRRRWLVPHVPIRALRVSQTIRVPHRATRIHHQSRS